MALATYTDLQDAANGWLNHTLFSTRLPDCIALFEATANRKLRTRQQETTTLLTPSSGAATLPTDYLLWRRVTWQGSPVRELEYVEPSYLQARYPDSPSGDPTLFTIEGASILIRPVSSTNLQLDYYAKVPSLSAGSPTNWLLTAHPDVYLFGTLCEAELFGINDERFPIWKGRRDEIFEEIQKLSNKSKGVGGMRLMTATP
jgi:hypothetical protein